MNKQPSRTWYKRPLIIALMTVGLVSGLPLSAHAAADTDRIIELERRLERSLQLIDELSNKVHKLEAKKTDAQLNDTVSKQNERLDGLEKQVSQVSTSSSKDHAGAGKGTPLHGFYDVGFVVSDQSNPQNSGPKGFAVGSIDLYMAPQLGDRVKSLVELIFEVDQDGTLATDLERVQVGYTFSDAATLWAGRFHTSYGYWNTALHHGAQIQTSILRPKFIDFEDKGGILPSHLTGLWLTGNVRTGENKVNYDLYAGNGPQLVQDTAGAAGVNSPAAGSDDNHQAFVGFKADYNFINGSAEGLRLGVHGFKGDVNDTDGDKTDVGMSGLYGTYITDDWEILSEYYRFRNKVKALSAAASVVTAVGDTHTSNAWFAQAGKNFGSFTPYVRVEKASLDKNDPYFFYQASGISYSRQAVGIRYSLNIASDLKLELNSTELNGTNANGTVVDNYEEARAQWSVRF